MGTIVINVSEEEVKKRLGNLANKSGLVISRAANRSITTGKKAIKQETAKLYNVRQKDVEECYKVKRATSADPMVRMTYQASHKNVFSFGRDSVLSPKVPIRSSSPYDPDPKYVSVKIMNSSGKVPLNGRPKPFVQIAAKSRNVGLFQRVSDDSRAEIRGVAAPAMPQVIKNEDVLARFKKDTYSMFMKRLDHEIEQILKGANT